MPHELPRSFREWGAGAKHQYSCEHDFDVNRLHDKTSLLEVQRHERMSDAYAHSRERQCAHGVRIRRLYDRLEADLARSELCFQAQPRAVFGIQCDEGKLWQIRDGDERTRG